MKYQHRISIRKEALRRHQIDKGSKIRAAADASIAIGRPITPVPALSISHFTRQVHLGQAQVERAQREAAHGVPAPSRQVLRHVARRAAKASASKARAETIAPCV